MALVACSVCGKPYPENGVPYKCICGGIFDYVDFPAYGRVQGNISSGLGTYLPSLGLPADAELISLGEGNTPLIPYVIKKKKVFLKMEGHNPSGSYKDRGSAVLASFLKSRGVNFAVEDSSGNAGASFAAYCARAGIHAKVFAPDSASGPKRIQIEAYGANLVLVPGARSEAAKAVLAAVDQGVVYGSHAWMPFGLCGIATIAYELFLQLGEAAGTIIVPVGHGGLLYGIMKGFENLAKAGLINRQPYFVGVQAQGCAPLVDAYRHQLVETRDVPFFSTLAEGVRVTKPARAKPILEHFQSGGGRVLAVAEDDLRIAWKESARAGFFMEPTSALVWAAALRHFADFKSPIVAVITGSGYKSSIPQ